MVNGQSCALHIVAFDRNQVFFAGAPADHRRFVPGIFAEKLPTCDILTAANDDEAIGLSAAGVIGKEICWGILK